MPLLLCHLRCLACALIGHPWWFQASPRFGWCERCIEDMERSIGYPPPSNNEGD